ncbi:MAG: 2-phosphosulfolactate phosphatase [Bacteroidetes bacterium]|nr:2-phosphosulfolactate phosphatase [Bacteroidota bacterium]
MPSVETIFSPALIQHHLLDDRYAVIIDVLRATTSICYALNEGAKALTPVATPEHCLQYRRQGYLCAAERNGLKLEGFDMGNSPDEFRREKVEGREIAITTTNGTYALLESQQAERIFIGAFVNLDALASFLIRENKDVVLVCAGWKNKVNLEDSLFAGALATCLTNFDCDCDSTLMAKELWLAAESNLSEVIDQSSHAQRFKKLGVDDLPLCLDMNRCPVVPEYIENRIVSLPLQNTGIAE